MIVLFALGLRARSSPECAEEGVCNNSAAVVQAGRSLLLFQRPG
ncbi:MAG: hypothetical protein ACKVS6_05885 [Planctomycetota bacterium]